MQSLGQGAKKLARDLNDPAKAQARGYAVGERLRAGLGKLAGGFVAAGRAAKRWAGRAGLGSWGDAAELAGRGVGKLLRKGASLAAGAAKWGAIAAGGAASFALFDLFSVASQFEQFRVVLENVEGSAAAAQKSLNWVKTFAQTTPYELADVMEAFVSLKAYGIDPVGGSLTAIGDAAAGMSKPIMQAVEAVADAMTGEYERLKEFGITAAVAGDKVTFTYVKAGKAISVVAKKGIEAEKAVEGIFNTRFGGMMAKQSATFAGVISNLKDSWSNFLLMVADAGIFDMVKAKINAILGKVTQWAKDGTLKAWAQKVSDWLEKAFTWADKFVRETDWGKVVSDMQQIANAALTFAKAINSIAWFFSESSGEKKLNSAIWGESAPEQWLNKKLWGGGDTPAPARPSNSAPTGKPGNGLMLSPAFMRKGGKVSANDVRVGGKTQIDVRVIGPATARVASLSSDNRNVPLQVNLGRIMAAPA